MKLYLSAPEFDLWHGDCIEVMGGLPPESVDAVVTDPPYELGFMGKSWDGSGIAYDTAMWAEVWRVLKPGGHLLSFGGTRTWHRLACAIEDAGFEIRDSIAWMYGSGFPKSLDVSKAIDRMKANRDEVLRFTAWVAEARDAAGITNSDIDSAFGFAGMAGHWTSQLSQPAVPTLEQMPRLLAVLGIDEMPDEIARLALRLNDAKGKPGENWFKREVVGSKDSGLDKGSGASVDFHGSKGRNTDGLLDITAPATPAAHQWEGWGTALKPAFEPIVVARKPLAGTVAANVLAHGTGALNIHGCRIAGEVPQVTQGMSASPSSWGIGTEPRQSQPHDAGRWPANVILDESQAAELDRQSGHSRDGVAVHRNRTADNDRANYSAYQLGQECGPDVSYGGEGGASRFFYTAKANSSERPRVGDVAHPTVKPLDLMQYLVRLVTPPGGVVLDPFAGSGTTAEACIIEGFRCITIELTAEYLPLIAQRLTKPIEVTLL